MYLSLSVLSLNDTWAVIIFKAQGGKYVKDKIDDLDKFLFHLVGSAKKYGHHPA